MDLEGLERIVLDVPRELQIDGIDNVHCHLVVNPLGSTYSRMNKQGDGRLIRVPLEIY